MFGIPDLDASILRATRFPPGAVAYCSVNLFEIANLYRRHLGLPEDLAALTTAGIRPGLQN